jgi:hypothetical protein
VLSRQVLCHCGWAPCPMIFWHARLWQPVGCSTVDFGCLFGFRRMSCLLVPEITNRHMMNNPRGSHPIMCSNLNRCPEHQPQHAHLDPTGLPDLSVHLMQYLAISFYADDPPGLPSCLSNLPHLKSQGPYDHTEVFCSVCSDPGCYVQCILQGSTPAISSKVKIWY